MKNEVLVQRTHRVNYDHAIRNAGVRMIEVEDSDALEKAINERTAMMFFLNSADPQGKIHHEEFVAIGKKHNVPTLIDAAADVPPVENLWRYTKMGFDLVGFSGGKGLRGPQSSGLLLGRKDLIEAAKLNFGPKGDTLCRTNKVNKEETIGMLVALEIVPEAGPRRGLEGLGGAVPVHRRSPRGIRGCPRPRSSCPRSPTRCRTCRVTLGLQEARADSDARWSRSCARASRASRSLRVRGSSW